MLTETVGLDNKVQHQIFIALIKSIGYLIKLIVRLKRPIENRAYLQVPKCTSKSLEISVIKIESLKELNQWRSTTKSIIIIKLHFYHLYHFRILLQA
jgi:hypothetical protein